MDTLYHDFVQFFGHRPEKPSVFRVRFARQMSKDASAQTSLAVASLDAWLCPLRTLYHDFRDSSGTDPKNLLFFGFASLAKCPKTHLLKQVWQLCLWTLGSALCGHCTMISCASAHLESEVDTMPFCANIVPYFPLNRNKMINFFRNLCIFPFQSTKIVLI